MFFYILMIGSQCNLELIGKGYFVKSAHHRIDNIEELTQSVKSLAVETKYLKEDISDVKEKIDVIAGRPSQILTVIITALITATVSGFVGFAITNLLK